MVLGERGPTCSWSFPFSCFQTHCLVKNICAVQITHSEPDSAVTQYFLGQNEWKFSWRKTRDRVKTAGDLRNGDTEIGRIKNLFPCSWPVMTWPSSFAPWDTPCRAPGNFLLSFLPWCGPSSFELFLDAVLRPPLDEFSCPLLFVQVLEDRAWTLL